MKKILILLFAIVIFGCVDNDNGNQDSGSLFSIKVTDVDGMPVNGLDVRVNNSFSNGFFGGRPQTNISFCSPENCHANIEIFDMYDQPVSILFDGNISSDQHITVFWNGKNDDDESANIGGTNIFKYTLKLTSNEDSTEVILEDSKYMCMELLNVNAQSNIGQTDQDGRFAFNNLNAFPHLFNDMLGEQPRIDEDGNYTGTFTLSDTINIKLVKPETDEYMLFTVLMDDSDSHYYNLIWDDPIALSAHRDIELDSFTGMQLSNEEVGLEWATSMESDLAGFNLYRNEEDIPEGYYMLNDEFISAGYNPDGVEYSYCDEDISEEEITYYYWLEMVNNDGTTELFGPVSVDIVIENNEIPAVYELKQNYPNPFN